MLRLPENVGSAQLLRLVDDIKVDLRDLSAGMQRDASNGNKELSQEDIAIVQSCVSLWDAVHFAEGVVPGSREVR